jgi:sugar phosphate isomerase/epimerase
MIPRRQFLAAAAAALPAFAKPAFKAEVGINIYSLRYLAEKDLRKTLALIRELGFRKVEVGNLYGRTPATFLRMLKSQGLTATSMGAAYKALDTDLNGVAAQAKALGVSYVVCDTIPHSAKHIVAKDVTSAADSLNRWGEALAASGLSLCYHTHGTEFDPSPDGTQFDTLLKLTNPKFVNYEMDIFWIVYGFQDPVKFLRRYPNRFPLMHIKDIKQGTKLGLTPADVAEDDSVPLGTGIVNVEAALLAGQDTGVKHFYLEEEAVDAVPQIRQSLQYLKTLRP